MDFHPATLQLSHPATPDLAGTRATRKVNMNVAIVGIGNVLAHDDAVGPTVARMLEAEWLLPVGVTVEDLGTPALELPSHLSWWDAVLLVDAVPASPPP